MNILQQKSQFFNQQPKPAPAFQTIAATNIQLGEGDVVATCDAKIGGVLVRQVAVRRGDDLNSYVEFPSAVELTSLALGNAVRGVVLAAVAEAMR